MSDQSAYPAPPPPPADAPPPVYQGPSQSLPVYQPPPPAFQPPQAAYAQPAQAPAGYAQPGYQWAPGQVPPPINPAAVGFGSAGFLLSQFGGYAAVSVAFGLASILAPFTFNFFFYFLPILGALNGWRAIMRGRVIGGAVGIGLNILGGLVSLVAFMSTR